MKPGEMVGVKSVILILVIALYSPCYYCASEGSNCKLSDGTEGVCLRRCAQNTIGASQVSCGSQGDIDLNCCNKESKPVRYPTIESLCNEQMILDKNGKRRKRQDESSGPNEHFHIAVLGWQSAYGSIEWECTGSLVHPSYVLTAAHCILNKGSPPNIVRVGGIDHAQDSKNDFVIDYEIKRVYLHSNYTPTEIYNDIALLKIAKTKDQDTTVNPGISCVWTKRDIPPAKLLALEYGATSLGKSHTYRLYKGNMTILDMEECDKHYQKGNHLPNGLVSSQFCAYDPEETSDTCQGDSGGPIQFEDSSSGSTYLVGLTSFGTICFSGTPAVYTRVYDFLDWMERILSERN